MDRLMSENSNQWFYDYVAKRLKKRGWVVIHKFNNEKEINEASDEFILSSEMVIYLNGVPKDLTEYFIAVENEITAIIGEHKFGEG